MGKRSNFERVKGDFYPTPYEACIPLFPHIQTQYDARGFRSRFIEPCAGDGRLIRHLESEGHRCAYACDIDPQAPGIEKSDVLFFNQPLPPCDLIITNPPWEREVLHAMIDRFTRHADTWLLFDADWMHTIQASPFSDVCRKIVSVGRVKWREDSDNVGMENAAWYLFSSCGTGTQFYFRQGN